MEGTIYFNDKAIIRLAKKEDVNLKYEAESSVNDNNTLYLTSLENNKNTLEFIEDVKKKINHKDLMILSNNPLDALNAYKLHASSFLLTPIVENDFLDELGYIKSKYVKCDHRIVAKTFGNFEFFVDGAQLNFKRNKSKELLAFLIDRKGALMTSAELIITLWEDKEPDQSSRSMLQTIEVELFRALEEAGVKSIIVKSRNQLGINPELIDCDYFRFLNGDEAAIKAYTGEYMTAYSWGEVTEGYLYDKADSMLD